MLLWEGRGEVRCHNVQDAQIVLEDFMEASPSIDAHQLREVTKTGEWIAVLPSTVSGT